MANPMPLEALYEDMVRDGVINPQPMPYRFSYPTELVTVPTFTTYSIRNTPELRGEIRAQLASDTDRD